jgi:hypothetical protein
VYKIEGGHGLLCPPLDPPLHPREDLRGVVSSSRELTADGDDD